MDQNGPPIPPDSLLQSAVERPSADFDPPPGRSCGSEPRDRPSVDVYYRDEAEVRDGFLIALRAMGLADIEQPSEVATPPVGSAKP